MLILRLATVRVALAHLAARSASSVVHYHFWFQGLVDNVSIAAWASSAYVNVSTTLLTVTRLLEGAARATRHHVGVMWVRHVVVLLLAEGLAAVGGHGSTRGAIDNATAIAGIGQRMITCTLIVHCLILGCSEASVDTLADHLIKGASHLLLGFIVVDHALRVRLAGSAEIVLIIATVAGPLGKYRVSDSGVIGHLLHEVVVL